MSLQNRDTNRPRSTIGANGRQSFGPMIRFQNRITLGTGFRLAHVSKSITVPQFRIPNFRQVAVNPLLKSAHLVKRKLNLGELSGVGRTAFKRVTPMASAVGAAADFASPLGNYSDYLSWATGLTTMVLLVYWLGFRSKAKPEDVEESIVPKALIYCGASAIIFTGISISKASADTPSSGIIASHIPALADLQRSLFRLEATTKEMNVKLDRIEDNVNQLKKVYNIEQIQKLEEQEIWEDVITHLEDIDPLKREDEWQRLLENSVYEYMRDLDRRQEHQKAGEVANDVFEKYKTLKRSDRAMKLRNKLLIHRIKACYQSREPMEDC